MTVRSVRLTTVGIMALGLNPHPSSRGNIVVHASKGRAISRIVSSKLPGRAGDRTINVALVDLSVYKSNQTCG